jgi:hypothetical protein
MTRRFSALAVLLAVTAAIACPPAEDQDKIEVKVVAILASQHKNKVDAKLASFAKHVQAKDPSLTGFRIDKTDDLKIKLGETQKVKLVGGEVVEVTVNQERSENGKVVLTITPPKLRQITYECVCDKYFPIATQHYVGKDKDRERLFIAIMAKPCGNKAKGTKK